MDRRQLCRRAGAIVVTITMVDDDGAVADGLMIGLTNGVNPALADLDWAPGVGLIGNSYNLLFSFEDNLGLAGITSPQGLQLNVVPEPSSFILAGLGLIGLVTFGWRRRTR